MHALRGKVAVITGAASGIGLAVADACATEGMTIIRADIEGPLRLDVSDPAAVEALAAQVFRDHGAVHLLMNNAGVAGATAPSWQLTLEDWQWSLGVNLWGVIHGIRAFVPRMIASGEPGHVVNTASIMGLISSGFVTPYCSSKHAVVAITEGLEMEFRALNTDLHASVLCPAAVATRIMDSDRNRPKELAHTGQIVNEEAEKGIRAAIAAGMAPSEVARQVLEAIREERFWILPHAETRPALAARAQAVIDGRYPFQPKWGK